MSIYMGKERAAPYGLFDESKREREFKDMRGRYGRVTVLKRVYVTGKSQDVYWEVLCDCGVVQTRNTAWVKQPKLRQCSVCTRAALVARLRKPEDHVPPVLQRSQVYTFVRKEGDRFVVQCKHCNRYITKEVSKIGDLGNARLGCRKCYNKKPKEFKKVQKKRVRNTLADMAKAACEAQGVQYLRLNKSKDSMVVKCGGCRKEVKYRISRDTASSFRAPKYGCKNCWEKRKRLAK